MNKTRNLLMRDKLRPARRPITITRKCSRCRQAFSQDVWGPFVCYICPSCR